MKIAILIFACIFFFGATACGNAVDKLVAERHIVKYGKFHHFVIGMGETSALTQMHSLAPSQVRNVCTISNIDTNYLLPFRVWQFYDVSVHPNGATYCLYFKNGSLILIQYLRERIQVE
ncbi:MAG TPA: hypothetical protein VFJ04_06750 [Rhodanobacteraceae bacterium]|nr:hypothetical protein [Rhodanobacteraceae bacterium]